MKLIWGRFSVHWIHVLIQEGGHSSSAWNIVGVPTGTQIFLEWVNLYDWMHFWVILISMGNSVCSFQNCVYIKNFSDMFNFHLCFIKRMCMFTCLSEDYLFKKLPNFTYHVWKKHNFLSLTWVEVLAFPFISCVTLGKLFHLSAPQFPVKCCYCQIFQFGKSVSVCLATKWVWYKY